jgi:hypothetical protein
MTDTSGAGTGSTAPTGTDNIFAVTTEGTAVKFLVDATGDIWYESVGGTAWDAHDDIALLRAVQRSVAPQDVINKEFDKFLTSNEDDLVKLGILGGTREEGGLVCLTALTQLITGGVVQLYEKILDRDKRIEALETKMLAIGG